MRRSSVSLVLLLCALPALSAGAQIIRSGRLGLREPQLWISGGAGLLQGWRVDDGATGTRWQFSDAMQYGAAVERTINGGTSLGLRVSTARVPLLYAPAVSSAPALEADATVSQAFAALRVSSGREFHTVLELGAGATLYHGFEERATGGELPPNTMDADFAFVLGYGFGYTFSRAFQIDVVQDLTTSLHQKQGLAAGDRRSARITSTRLVARFGLGN